MREETKYDYIKQCVSMNKRLELIDEKRTLPRSPTNQMENRGSLTKNPSLYPINQKQAERAAKTKLSHFLK